MIQERVLAINDVFITTDSGKKTPLGNRIFEIGDLVWTDGNYVFGTKKNTNFPMQMAAAMPYTGKYFIWQGVITNPIFRIYNAETLEFMEIPGTIIGGRFIYNSKGTKFAWLMGSGNQVQIYILTATGYSNFTVTLPYSYNGALGIDGYIDDAGDVYWSAYINNLTYDRYYNDTAEVFNTSGHVAILKYKNDELINNNNLTDKILEQNEAAWQSCLTEATNSEALIKTIAYAPTEEEVASWNTPDTTLTNWALAWQDVWEFTDEIIIDPINGSTKANNKPQLKNFAIDFINYEDSKINNEISFASGYWVKARDGNGFYEQIGDIYHVYECGDIWINNNSNVTIANINENFNEKSYSSHEITGDIVYAKYTYTLTSPRGTTNEYIYYHETDEIDWALSTGISVYPVYSCDCGYGFTFEYHPVVSTESGSTPAYYLLKNANWSMDVSTMVDNFTNFLTPPQVTPLDDARILFLNCPNNALYMINITNNSYQLLSNSYTDNGRIPLITGQTQAELIRLLTKVPS